MDALETIEKDGFTLKIFQDDSPDSPLNWGWPVERLDTNYNLESMDGRDIVAQFGNIWFSEVNTQDRNRVYIVCQKSDWIKAMKQGAEKAAYHGWDTTKAGMQKMVDSMAEIYQQYAEGDVYGYTVSLSGEVKDSCWGFYGMDHVMEDGKAALAACIQTEKEAQAFEKGAMAL